KKSGERLSDRLVHGTVKFGGGSLMMWGCMTWEGVGYAAKIDGHLKRRLVEHEHPPKGMEELWRRIEDEWNKIPAEVCQKLIESMPRRIEAVIKARGGYTKY
ncbi:hypothetical protein BDR04DRAFT_1018812, partial [Suillus decipiens]